MHTLELRPLGNTGLHVSPVALGCWPMAGMTSLDVNERDSLATLEACLEIGVNFLDTAYCYGAHGESEMLIAKALRHRRDEFVIATKCGIHWNAQLVQEHDARPDRLRQEVDESLKRLQTDRVELLYLHAPDPATPIAESAGALRQIMEAGKTRSVGVSNFSLEQIQAFHAVCPITAVQPPYNMLQRQVERDLVPWCQANGVAVAVYWPLMKGLLTGKLARDHVFRPGDGRAKYPMFHGEEWEKNQDFLDELRGVAAETGHTTAQVVINWTIHRPGITVALCGAKRPEQIRDNAGAMGWRLSPAHLARIDAALARRGEAVVRRAV
jgi:aryl-alcohol dehydrogenase-like predicted oxidoreductase